MEDQPNDKWKRISEIFGSQPAPDHSEFFVERVMEGVRRPEPSKAPARPAWWWVPALTPAFAALLLVMVWSRPAVSVEALLDGDSAVNGELSAPASGDLLEI